MTFQLPRLLLCLGILVCLSSTAEAQTTVLRSSGTSGAPGVLDITIETFGTLATATTCNTDRYTFAVPIPSGATCQIMTQSIFNVLSVGLAGIFEVTQSLPACSVYLRRQDGNPECTYFETKLRGDWQGMTFTVGDDPTPVEATSWSWLKHSSWRQALRGEVVTRRR